MTGPACMYMTTYVKRLSKGWLGNSVRYNAIHYSEGHFSLLHTQIMVREHIFELTFRFKEPLKKLRGMTIEAPFDLEICYFTYSSSFQVFHVCSSQTRSPSCRTYLCHQRGKIINYFTAHELFSDKCVVKIQYQN